MKNIIQEKGKTYFWEEKENGFMISCWECGKEDWVGEDHPKFEIYKQISGSIKGHLCKNCFIAKMNALKAEKEQGRINDIWRGQATNLAVNVALKIYEKDKIKDEKELWKAINHYYDKFHKFLIEKNERQL